MGLDVGVVKIAYLERPPQPIYDFLWSLVEEVDYDVWGGVWEGNAFLEIMRRRMLSKARAYAKEKDLSQEDSDKLRAWMRALPWDGGTIMLHLYW